MARATVDGSVQQSLARTPAVPVRDRLVREPGSRYIDFLIPGLLGMNLMSGALWGIGWSLVDLRVRKLLKRLRASPMRPSQLIFAIGLARMFVIPLEVLVILGFAHLTFGVPVAGSLGVLALAVLVGALAFSGIAVLVGSRAINAESASGMVNLVMLPMFVLSGVFFSAEHFPAAIQPLIDLLPLSALNDALRAVVLDGAGLTAISGPLLILTAWGVITFLLGLRLFRWV